MYTQALRCDRLDADNIMIGRSQGAVMEHLWGVLVVDMQVCSRGFQRCQLCGMVLTTKSCTAYTSENTGNNTTVH
jgi:hypothetical protein